MLFRPAGSLAVANVAGANGSLGSNRPRPSDVATAQNVFLSSDVHWYLARMRYSSAGSHHITSLPFTIAPVTCWFLSRFTIAIPPQWVNGGHQLKAYDRENRGVVGASMLS